MEQKDLRNVQAVAVRTEGYQNTKVEPDPAPFPASQAFGMVAPTVLVDSSGTVGWTTIDVSRYVPIDATFFVGYFRMQRTGGATDFTFDVRRDGQSDSPTYEAFHGYAAADYAAGTLFIVQLTGNRSFDYRLNGTATASTTWRMEARGYHTATRNTANANTINGVAGNSGGGSDSIPAGL